MMPRTGKGGGPGPTNAGGPSRGQAPRVAAGSVPYGERQQLEQGQREMPIADEAGNFSSRLERTVEAAQQMPRRGVGLRAASTRPGEPLTAGLSRGEGAGPSAIPPVARAAPNMEDAKRFARVLPALEAGVSNNPRASVKARNFVRQIRGMTPVDFRQDDT